MSEEDKSKKWLTIGFGVAAFAVAAYMLYSSGNGSSQGPQEEEIKFKATKSQEQLDKDIAAYIDEEINELLSENKDGLLAHN